jgi:hypothetical protein
MGFKEDLEKAVEKIEDEAVRAGIINEVEQAHTTDVAGLKENRDQLINEKKEVVSKFETLETTLASLEGDSKVELERLEKINAELLANPGDEEKIKQLEVRSAEKLRINDLEHKGAIDLIQKDLLEREGRINSLDQEIVNGLRQAGLSASLDKANVKVEDKPLLMRALLNDVYVETIGVERKVKFKHGALNTPYPIEDGIKTWAGDPLNKRYIAAINNRGAGAGGSQGNSSIVSKPYKEMSYEEKVALKQADPELFAQVKANA